MGVGLMGLLGLLTVGGVGFGLWLRTDAGDTWLEGQVQTLVTGLLTEGSFQVGDVDLALLAGRLELRDVVLRSAADEDLLVLPHLGARFDPTALLGGTVKVTRLVVDGPFVDLLTDDEGVMVLARMFGSTAEVDPAAEPWAGLPVDLDLRDVQVRGLELWMRDAEATSLRVAGVDAHAEVLGTGKRFRVRNLEAGALLVVPGPLPLALTGAEVVYDDGHLAFDDLRLRAPDTDVTVVGSLADTYDLTLTVEALSLPAFDAVAGHAGLTGGLVGSARVVGQPDDAKAIVTLDGTDGLQGGLRLRLGADLAADRPTWSVEGQVLDLHADGFLASLTDPIVVAGALDVQGAGVTWPDDLVADARFQGARQELAGLALDAVDLGAHVEDGVIYLADDGYVQGIVGRIGATGWYDVKSGLVDVRAEGTLEPEPLAALGVAGLGRTGRFQARVLGDTASSDPLLVDGTVAYAPFVYDGVWVEQLGLAFDLVVDGARVGGDLDLTGTTAEAYGATLGRLGSEGLRFQLHDDGAVDASGALAFESLGVPDVLYVSTVGTEVAVGVAADGAVTADVGFDIGPYALLDGPGVGGTGRVHLAGDNLDLELQLDAEQRETAYVLGRFHLDEQRLELAQLRVAPTGRVAFANDRPVRLRLTEEGGVADADVSMVSPLGTVRFEGQAGTAGPLDGVLTVDDLQLDLLAELFPDAADGVSGQASAVVRLEGTGEVPDLKATVDLRDLYVPETLRYLDVLGTVRWQGDALRPDLKLAVADAPFAAVYGALPLAGGLGAPAPDLDGPVDLVVDLRPSAFERVGQLAPSVPAESLPDGSYGASLQVRGPLRQPDLHFAGITELTVRGWDRPGRVEFDVLREGSALSFWADVREGYAQRANLGGGGLTRFGEVWTWALEGGEQPPTDDLTLWLDSMFVSGVLLGVPLRSLAAFAELGVPLDGELVGGVSVSGSPVQPVVEGGIHWIDPRVGATRFDGAYASIAPTDGGYALDSQVSFPGDGGFAVTGDVPVVIDLDKELGDWSLADLGLRVEGAGLPLALLAVADPGIKKADGLLVIDGTIGGRVDDPSPELTVHLEGGSLQYVPLGLAVSDMNLDLAADRRRVKLTRFEARTEPHRKFRASGLGELGGEASRVTMSGSAQLEEWVPGAMSAQVRLRGGTWLSATDAQSLRADGDLQVSGEWPALNVDGGVELVLGEVVLDAAAFIDTAPLDLDPRMAVRRAAYREEEDAEEVLEPSFYSDFLVDVAVDLKRNLQVDVAMPFIDDLGALGAAVTRANVSSRLGGDLTATLTDGELDLVGEVDVLEGKVGVLRSNFDLSEGKVIFSGGDPFNPLLDLEAVMNIPDATVKMDIAGTPETPEIEFSSEQYPDQTQIMTILLTGQAPSELGADQGQGTAQALAGLLLNSLFAGQSLGSFSIEPDGSVVLGVPISQTIYANSSLSPTANPTENRLTFGLEWSVLPRVVASGTVGDRTQSADVFWEIRF